MSGSCVILNDNGVSFEYLVPLKQDLGTTKGDIGSIGCLVDKAQKAGPGVYHT